MEVTAISAANNTSKNSKSKSVATGGVDTGLSIFKPRKYELGIDNDIKIEYYPLASIQKSKCIEFMIPASNSLYFELKKNSLRMKVKLTESDGKKPADTKRIAFTNGPGFSLFRQVDVELQQKLISSEIGTHYAYKGILDNLVFLPNEFVSTGARRYLYTKDTAGAMNSTTVTNAGFVVRYEYSKGGKEVLIETPIFHDLFQTDEFLPSNMQLKVRLWPNADAFAIMSGETGELFKYEIEECILRMRGCEVNKTVVDAHNALLTKSNAVLHYQKSVLKSYNIPQGTSSWTVHQFLNNQIPYQLLVSFVSSSASLGEFDKNPYNFENFGLNFLSLETEGYQNQVFKPDYDNDHCVEEYDALYEPSHGYVYSYTPVVHLEDFANGYAIYRFVLGSTDYERAHRPKKGLSRLLITFKSAVTTPVLCLVYAKFHSHLEIDIMRNVYLDNECTW